MKNVTKLEMAQRITKQLLNMDTLPAPTHHHVKKLARQKKSTLAHQLTLAIAAEKSVAAKHAAEARVGTKVVVMCSGHIVDAKIVSVEQTYAGSRFGDPAVYTFTCELICMHFTGDTRICRDAGQNWFIEAGETFHAGENNIDAAARHVSRVA
jgi:hypothetical protein